MDSKIITGPRETPYGAEQVSASSTKISNKRKEIIPLDSSENNKQSSSSKFRKIAENARQKNLPHPVNPSEINHTENASQSSINASARYRSLKTIAHLLPPNTSTFSQFLLSAEKSFDLGLPYFLAKQKSKSPPLYRDASALFDHLFNELDTFYRVGTPEHIAWRKDVEDQDFLLFTGSNSEPVVLGSIYKMFADGLDDFCIGLLLMAANPKDPSFLNESKELINFLYQINYLPSQYMPSHTNLLHDISETDRSSARQTLAVSLASIDGSPIFAKLLQEGISINQRDIHTGFVPLTAAIVNNAKKNVDLLLKHGADLTIDKNYLEGDNVLTDENKNLVEWAQSKAAEKDKS